jgi:hypothetical protein
MSAIIAALAVRRKVFPDTPRVPEIDSGELQLAIKAQDHEAVDVNKVIDELNAAEANAIKRKVEVPDTASVEDLVDTYNKL